MGFACCLCIVFLHSTGWIWRSLCFSLRPRYYEAGTLSVQCMFLLGLDSLFEADLPGDHRRDRKVDLPGAGGVILDQFRLLALGLDSVERR